MELFMGDCLELLGDIKDKSIDLVIIDPPYLKSYSTGYRKNIERKNTEILNDREFNYDKLFSEYKRIMKEDAHLYVFGCWQKCDYFKKIIEKYFKIKNKLIWVKNNWTAGDIFWTYGQSYEEIWFCSNGRKRLNGGRDRDCLFYNRVAGKSQLHLNQKPIELIEFLIEKSSKIGDVILDSFMGSGTTGVACNNLKREFIGMELDEKYFKIAEKRLDFTQ